MGKDDQEVLARAERALGEVGEHLSGCSFRLALSAAMGLAQAANRYLDSKAPWKALADDPQAAGTSLWVTLVAISALKTAMFPFLPFSTRRLHRLLGFAGEPEEAGWGLQRPEPGQPLPEPQALFVKLDDSVAEEEQRMARTAL